MSGILKEGVLALQKPGGCTMNIPVTHMTTEFIADLQRSFEPIGVAVMAQLRPEYRPSGHGDHGYQDWVAKGRVTEVIEPREPARCRATTTRTTTTR